MDPINNMPALVQIMAWRRPGDKPLSEPKMVSLLTHICVTQPQWENHVRGISLINNWPTDCVTELLVDSTDERFINRNVFSGIHYSDVKWPHWHLELPVNQVFVQQLIMTTKKHQRSGLLSLSEGNPPANSPHKGTVTRKIFPFDGVMISAVS